MTDKFISYKFVDSKGILRDKVVRTGKGLEETWFDGSSFGFCPTNKSDLLLAPDDNSQFYDPIREMQSVFCFLKKPSGEPLLEDFRTQAAKLLESDEQTKGAKFGVEPEFFILNGEGRRVPGSEDFPIGINHKKDLDNVEQGAWYGALPPLDCFSHIRDEVVNMLELAGFEIEGVHHEVGPGQAEMSWRCSNLLRTCDKMLLFKYIVGATVAKFGHKVSFEAKPFPNLNGNGCHTHQSIPAMREELHGKDVLMCYAEGIVDNYDELLKVCCVGESSLQRLVPNFEAPTKENNGVGWHDRTKTVRIPARGKRIEYRLPDPEMNPYVALSKMLYFGRENVKRKMGI